MKRLLFMILLGAIGITWLRAQAGHCPGHYREPRRAATAVIMGDSDVPAVYPAESRFGHVEASRRDPLVVAQRESVGDIPIGIVPGTRVTDAEIRPPHPPRAAVPARPPHRPAAASNVVGPPATHTLPVVGRLSATDDRARDDARRQLEVRVADWLAPDVPASWKTPKPMLDSLVKRVEVKPVEKELGTLYEATMLADFSPSRRAAIVDTYHRELVARRLTVLGGVLAFILACLAVLAGYIRADEATKGYYTNRLRLVSAAGVGAAGVVIYELLT